MLKDTTPLTGTPPFHWPPHVDRCCTAGQAWHWVNAVAEMAVDGDDDAKHALPATIDHYLTACRGVLR